MTQYAEILHSALALNVLAIVYRCEWHRQWYQRICSWSIPMFSSSPSSDKRRPRSLHKDGAGDKASLSVRAGDHEREVISLNGDVGASPSIVDSFETERCESSRDETLMARRHRRLLYCIYLPVYLLATSADWLQGPYKYAVYSAYGYDQRAISILFVAGFGSGMSLGSVVGGLADTWGRKRMTCFYCLAYMLSCLAKHFRTFWILLIGRVLGGIATSLLFSVFDAWLIRAHADRHIDKTYLGKSFSAANFGSSVVAILAGLLANAVVGDTADGGTKSTLRPAFPLAARRWALEEAEVALHGGDAVGPPETVDDKRWDAAFVYMGGGIRAFDLALIPLALCLLLALAFWEENYGDDRYVDGKASGRLRISKKRKKLGMFAALRGASVTVWRSPAIFSLCAVSSFFEGAMYVFILLWTPALRALDKHPEEENYPGPPLGLVFATFMVCCMLGTSIFSILTSMGLSPARILVYALLLSAVSCFTISQSSDDTLSYYAMLMFEACIGAYYPAMSTVKGNIVPEDQRAAIYSVFRLPLNFVVLLNLFTNLGFKQSFGVCAAMLSVSVILQMRVNWCETNSCQITESYTNEEMRPIFKTKDSNIVDNDGCVDYAGNREEESSRVKRRPSWSSLEGGSLS